MRWIRKEKKQLLALKSKSTRTRGCCGSCPHGYRTGTANSRPQSPAIVPSIGEIPDVARRRIRRATTSSKYAKVRKFAVSRGGLPTTNLLSLFAAIFLEPCVFEAQRSRESVPPKVFITLSSPGSRTQYSVLSGRYSHQTVMIQHSPTNSCGSGLNITIPTLRKEPCRSGSRPYSAHIQNTEVQRPETGNPARLACRIVLLFPCCFNAGDAAHSK